MKRGPESSRAGLVIAVILFACASLLPVVAHAESPLAGGFDELFRNQGRAIPIFARDETIARLPPLPRLADESAHRVASPGPPPEAVDRRDGSSGLQTEGSATASARENGALHEPTADVVEIEMRSNAEGTEVWFDPVGVLVQPGQTIRWVNRDPRNSHTTTAYHPDNFDHPRRIPEAAKLWNSGYLREGETFSIHLTEEGVYDYFCKPHEKAGMVGRIVVRRTAGAIAQHDEAGPGTSTGALPDLASQALPPVADILSLHSVHSHPSLPPAGASMGTHAASPSAAERRAASRGARSSNLANVDGRSPPGPEAPGLGAGSAPARPSPNPERAHRLASGRTPVTSAATQRRRAAQVEAASPRRSPHPSSTKHVAVHRSQRRVQPRPAEYGSPSVQGPAGNAGPAAERLPRVLRLED